MKFGCDIIVISLVSHTITSPSFYLKLLLDILDSSAAILENSAALSSYLVKTLQLCVVTAAICETLQPPQQPTLY